MEKITFSKKFLSDFADRTIFIFESEEPMKQTEDLADIGLAFLNICSYAENEKKVFDTENFFNPSNKLFSDLLIDEIEKNERISKQNSDNVKKRYKK